MARRHREEIRDAMADVLKELAGSVDSRREHIRRAESELESLSPLKVLSRGYSYVTKDGRNVRSADRLSAGDRLSVTFSDGEAICTVDEVKTNER